MAPCGAGSPPASPSATSPYSSKTAAAASTPTPRAGAALLSAALKAAGVPTYPAEGGVAARVLVAPKSVLVACVNETPSPARRRVVVEGRPVEIPVEGLRSRLVLFERATGKVLAVPLTAFAAAYVIVARPPGFLEWVRRLYGVP